MTKLIYPIVLICLCPVLCSAAQPWQEVTVPSVAEAAQTFADPPKQYGAIHWAIWGGPHTKEQILADIENIYANGGGVYMINNSQRVSPNISRPSTSNWSGSWSMSAKNAACMFGELFHPRPQQLLLLLALRAIGVVGGERLFRQHIQPRKQSQAFINIAVVNMAQPFLAQQFEREQTEQSHIRGNHLAPRITRLAHQRIKFHSRQQRNKQEDTRRPGSDTQWFVAGELQRLPVGDRRDRVILPTYGRAVPPDGLKKGECVDLRRSSKDRRNSCTNSRNEPYWKPNTSATSFCGLPSTMTARIASYRR